MIIPRLGLHGSKQLHHVTFDLLPGLRLLKAAELCTRVKLALFSSKVLKSWNMKSSAARVPIHGGEFAPISSARRNLHALHRHHIKIIDIPYAINQSNNTMRSFFGYYANLYTTVFESLQRASIETGL